MQTIAGHTFIDTVNGDQCPCGQLWIMIEDTAAEDIGKPDIAHVGTLNEQEYLQIATERERKRARKMAIWEAVTLISKDPMG